MSHSGHVTLQEIPKNTTPVNMRFSVRLLSWLSKALEGGNAEAARRLTSEYEKSARRSKEYAKKMYQTCRRGFELGDSYCTLALGSCYLNGIGTDENEQEAFRFFDIALKAKEPRAALAVAKCYADGRGTQADESKAMQLLYAVAGRDADSAYEFASLIERFLSRFNDEVPTSDPLSLAASGAPQNLRTLYERLMIEQHEVAASYGCTKSMNWLAERLRADDNSEANRKRAIELTAASAKRGDVDGMLLLAGYYQEGPRSTTSDKKAARLYATAAKRGSAEAQLQYGQCLMNGIGVRMNPAAGMQLVRRSALNGCPDASALIESANRQLEEINRQLRERPDIVQSLMQDAFDIGFQSTIDNMNAAQQSSHEAFMRNHGY